MKDSVLKGMGTMLQINSLEDYDPCRDSINPGLYPTSQSVVFQNYRTCPMTCICRLKYTVIAYSSSCQTPGFKIKLYIHCSRHVSFLCPNKTSHPHRLSASPASKVWTSSVRPTLSASSPGHTTPYLPHCDQYRLIGNDREVVWVAE